MPFRGQRRPSEISLSSLFVGLLFVVLALVIIGCVGLRRCWTNSSERVKIEPYGDVLDTPLVDPDSEGRDNEPQLLRDFKSLVQTDYMMAEAIYAGGVFAILLWFSQQGVRVYKHCYFMPDSACPWQVEPSLADTLLQL